MECQRPATAGGDNTEVVQKLDEISKKLASLEEKIEKGAETSKRDRPKRPRPNPNDVYSVPVGDSPYKGAEHAKITVVEAFEFA